MGFLKNRTVKIALLLVVVLLAGVAAAAVSHDAASPLTKAVSLIFSPLQSVSARLADSFNSFNGGFVSSGAYVRRIGELELEIENYRGMLVDYEKMKQQIALYENILGVREEMPGLEICPAAVIARDPAELFRAFVINKGSAQGIKVNDPVIYGKQLVGVVKEVNLTTSLVRTILDPQVNIGAYEVRSREDGYIENTARLALSEFCCLAGLERTTAVLPGGLVCTSGVGGVFPRDLIIGTVTELGDRETDISSYAVVKPEVDFAGLIDVFVITSFLGQGE